MASAKASSFHMTALPEAFPSLAMLCVEEVQFTGGPRQTPSHLHRDGRRGAGRFRGTWRAG